MTWTGFSEKELIIVLKFVKQNEGYLQLEMNINHYNGVFF